MKSLVRTWVGGLRQLARYLALTAAVAAALSPFLFLVSVGLVFPDRRGAATIAGAVFALFYVPPAVSLAHRATGTRYDGKLNAPPPDNGSQPIGNRHIPTRFLVYAVVGFAWLIVIRALL